MSYTHVNKDNTLFKTVDAKYINYRDCDVTGIVVSRFKPFKMIPILSQPKFYLVSEEWDQEEGVHYPTLIQGPYHDKNTVESRLLKTDYVLLATDEGIEEFKQLNGLVERSFAIC